MTRSEAVSIIQQQLGFRTDLSSVIVTNLQLAQTMLEDAQTKPWFLISEDSFTYTEDGEPRIPIPDDFLQETEQAVLRYVPDDAETIEDEVDLRKEYYDTLRENFMAESTTEGPPEAYALVGNYFRIFPTPDDTYRLRLIYYKRAPTLDLTSSENGWLEHCPFLLIGKAGGMVASAIRDKDALAVFNRWEAEGRIAMYAREVDRDMANRDMQIGGPQ